MTPSEKTSLRQVELHGPALAEADHSFWRVRLIAPQHGLKQHGLELVRPKRSGTQVERTHPMRTLLLEVTRYPKHDRGRRVRLLSTHLIGGVDGTWADNDDSDFGIRIGGRDWGPLKSKNGDNFRTDVLDGKQTGRPQFHHLTAAPLLQKDAWPVPDVGENPDISCPPCRLEQGALALLFSSADQLPWMDVKALGLQPVPLQNSEKNARFRLVLVKDGIELDARAPFPGQKEALPGHFLLAPDGAGGLVLRLLPEKLAEAERAAWLAAWRNLAPSDDAKSEQLAGFKVLLNTRTVPAFSWRVNINNGGKITGLASEVIVPATAASVRLLGPRGVLDRDGDIALTPGEWVLSPAKNPGALNKDAIDQLTEGVLVKSPVWAKPGPVWSTPIPKLKDVTEEVSGWASPAILTALIVPPLPKNKKLHKAPDTSLRLHAKAPGANALKGTLIVRNGGVGHALAHDEVLLAAALRSAQGLPEPAPGAADPARPLLWGFTPLDDGWLQLPLPNLPRPDPAKDASFIRPRVQAPPNVVSGFLRYGEAQAWPQILSAFDPAKPRLSVERAPWLVTLEGTQGLAVAVALGAGGTGPGEALAHLFGPELSTRGLLWLSSDRPDAEEALPRIGAGAGQYLDVPLESHDVEEDPIVPVTLRGLEFTMTEMPAGQQSQVQRQKLQIDVGFDATEPKWTRLYATKELEEVKKQWEKLFDESWGVLLAKPPAGLFLLPPVFWLRHPTMPLAALMAMTRSASAVVRPLESRDLVPFVLDPDKQGAPPLLLKWEGATQAVFPQVLDARSGKPPELRPLSGWPWGENAGSTDVEKIEQGIGLCAFGVPGTELNFTSTDADDAPWTRLQFALRFDLPALDEAFATAALPPVPKVKTPDEIDLAPPAVPVATALDWRGLGALWRFKEERHRQARVMHSYLFAYAPMNAPADRDVVELVGGAIWKTRLDFKPGTNADKLPYGAATVDGTDVNGNVALLGFSGTPTLPWTHGGSQKVDVTGYAPATIEDGVYLTDARGTGLGEMSKVAGKPLWRRPVQIRTPRNPDDPKKPEKLDLVTMQVPETVFRKKDEALFFFLFKDLPMDDKTLALGLDPEAWQDGKLPRSGAEWRLCPAQSVDATNAFERGRDRLPFFGFGLEPLQLTKCILRADDRVETAKIVARLHLGPRQGAFLPVGNLVDVTFTWSKPLGAPELGELEITDCVTPGGKRLRFHLEAVEAGAPARGVEITAVCGWDKNLRQPVFSEVEIELPMFQRATKFAGAKMVPAAAAGDPVRITWDGAKPPETIEAGKAKFGVEEIAIEAQTETTSDPVQPKLAMKRWIALLPASALAENESAKPALLFRLGPADGVREAEVFGHPLALTKSVFEEHRGSFSLTLGKSEPFSVFPDLSGAISLGWIARLPDLKNGTAELDAGHLSARWVETVVDKLPPVPNRILLEAGRATRGGADRDRWLGTLTLHVRATVDSAIGWPRLEKFEPAILPWPPKENPVQGDQVNNRVALTFSDDQPVLDQVTYFLDGQAMSCVVASRLAQSDDDAAVFALPVAAQHRFLRGDNVLLRFSSVETIVLGRAHSLIPEPGDPNQGYAGDPIAFGARYRDKVKNGATSNTATKGMDIAGRGRISKLLSGALGHAFRAVVWPELKGNPLVIAGGFVGLAAWESAGAPSAKPLMASLVRVPVLAWPGTSLALKQSEKEITIAWTDTPVALPMAASFRTTAVPASSAFSALCAAIQESAPSGRILAEGFESAALVEQSFRLEMDDDVAGKLTTNFFPAAAVSISKLIDLGDNRKDAPMTISMLAGRALVEVAEDKPPELQAFAASLLLRGRDWGETDETGGTTQQAIDPVSAASLLATLGDDVVLSPWSGPSAAMARAIISARAVAEHAEPLVALVVQIEAGDASATCTAQPAARKSMRPVYRQPVPKTVFADPARGYALNGEEHERWLRGLEEGITRPIRDAAKDEPADGITRSGLAGMSHTLSLPRQTRELAAPIYFSETRAPIYQPPLDLRHLESPPIPWLAPGRTRPRLPTHAALERALTELFSGQEIAGFFQWIVPAGGVSASIGDRAGILLARLSRLETALNEIKAFDRAHERFGRPGQGSAWSVRTERTPRPGPLPKNTGEAARDRRPCASRLQYWRPLEALRGPADTIAGEPRVKKSEKDDSHGAWVVKMVAAADWEGMITDRFDTTVALDVEIDVGSPVDVTAWVFLQRTLLPPVQGDARRQASAELVVGSLVIPFQRLHLASSDEKFKKETAKVSGEEFTIHRAKLRLILDARLDLGTKQQPGAPSTALADALKASVLLPRVEVRFTVHPDSNRGTPAEAPDPVPLTLVDPTTAIMPHGESRPPVTLRLPLAPIVRSRGALPLPINTLLFIDPAYDEQLGSAPAVHRERVARPRFASGDTFPPNRGDLIGSLYADRARVNRRAGIVFMADLALEKPMSAVEQKIADANGADGGDLVKPDAMKPLILTFAVTTSEGERRELYFGIPAPAPLPETAPLPNAPRVQISFVYELSFSLLREKDGTAARLDAGDLLELTATEQTEIVSENGALVPKLKPDERMKPQIWKPENNATITLEGLDASGAGNEDNDIPFTRTVRILLTEEPVIEPPPALYAALTRRATDAATRLSLPLYAQSPLPWRVALRDAKADFRKGFVRRAATFIWSLARPSSEIEHTGVHIVKVDRNGQTYLPPSTIINEAFIPSRKIFNPSVTTTNPNPAPDANPCDNPPNWPAAPAPTKKPLAVMAWATGLQKDKFGCTRDQGTKFHAGIDIKAAVGTPCFATEDAKVEEVGSGTEVGKYVSISFIKGGKTYGVSYCHLSKTSVIKGASVKAGDKVGETGITGNAEPDNPHLHLEVQDQVWIAYDNSADRSKHGINPNSYIA